MTQRPLRSALAGALDAIGQEYAIGGAIALGFWAEPRGTIDLDLTLYLPPEEPTKCVRLLGKIGCEVSSSDAHASIAEYGFCRAAYQGVRVDTFLPTMPFYEVARTRRRRVTLGEQEVDVWDAESLTVFKLMFFRRKDIADIEQIVRIQAEALDRKWIRQQLVDIYGTRDPRVAQWDELDAEIPR